MTMLLKRTKAQHVRLQAHIPLVREVPRHRQAPLPGECQRRARLPVPDEVHPPPSGARARPRQACGGNREPAPPRADVLIGFRGDGCTQQRGARKELSRLHARLEAG